MCSRSSPRRAPSEPLPDDELVHPVRRAEPGKRRTVAHESHVADVADPLAAFGDDLGREQLTQPHGALPGSSTRSTSRAHSSLRLLSSSERRARELDHVGADAGDQLERNPGRARARAPPAVAGGARRSTVRGVRRPGPPSAPGPERIGDDDRKSVRSSANSSSRSSTLPARRPSASTIWWSSSCEPARAAPAGSCRRS